MIKCSSFKVFKNIFFNSKTFNTLINHSNIKPGISSKLIDTLPVVALVGRPNVGKSALFNRLIKRNEALVLNTPDSHVTRDYRYGIASLGDLRFNVIDTSGLEPRMHLNSIQARASCITKSIIQKSDAIIFILDAKEELTSLDYEISIWIKKTIIDIQKVFLVLNKCEKYFKNDENMDLHHLNEYFELGYGHPLPISAETGDGMIDLFSLIYKFIDEKSLRKQKDLTELQNKIEEGTHTTNAIKLAIMGLPNVGKSTLMNYLLNYERCLTGPEAGLTRDSVHDSFLYNNRRIEITDTAGWKKSIDDDKSDVKDIRLILDSSKKASQSLNFASVVVLLIDAERVIETEKVIVDKEVQLADKILEEKRVLIVAINKTDIVNKENYERIKKEFTSILSKGFYSIDNLKCVAISSKTGEGVNELLSLCIELYDKWNRKFATSVLNSWLQENLDCQKLGSFSIPALKRIKFMRQSNTRPPTFSLWISGSKIFTNTEKRTFINSFRKGFDIEGIPVRILYKYNKKWAEARRDLINLSRKKIKF